MISSDESNGPRETEQAAALGKRSRILLTVLAVIAVIAVIAAVVGFVQAWQAKRETDRILREATSLRLVAEAQSMLAHTRFEGDVRAFQQLIVARRRLNSQKSRWGPMS